MAPQLEKLTRLCPEDIVRFNRQGYLRVLGKRNRQRDVPVPPLRCSVAPRYYDAGRHVA